VTEARREFRYYEFVMVAFVVILVCSNLIGPAKIAQVELPSWVIDPINGLGQVAASIGLPFGISPPAIG